MKIFNKEPRMKPVFNNIVKMPSLRDIIKKLCNFFLQFSDELSICSIAKNEVHKHKFLNLNKHSWHSFHYTISYSL